MWHTVQEAVILTGRCRRTLYRDMAAGRVSYAVRANGRREMETSELIRAFGPLQGLPDSGTEKSKPVAQVDTAGVEAMAALQTQMANLTVMVERLSGMFEKIVNRLEHKPAAPAVQDSQPSKSFDDLWELVEALRPAVDSLERQPQDDRQPAAKAGKKAKGDKAKKGKAKKPK